MPQYDTPLKVTQIAGNVGRAPEIKEGTKGEFVSFSVAVACGYGDFGPDETTRWYRVAVNDPQVQAFVMAKFRKGTPVVLEGSEYTTEYQGVTQYNMTAYRAGVVDWFVKGSQPRTRQQEDEDL